MTRTGAGSFAEAVARANRANEELLAGRGEARIVGRAEPLRLDFRVTMVFRREDGAWRLAHRHADPLVEKQKP
jgi:hypothetical protein